MLGALSASALVVEPPQQQLANPARRDISPAVHKVVLAQLGHIHKSVAIAVVVHLSVLEVQQSGCRQSAVEVYASIEVDLGLQFTVLIDIGPHPIGTLWLEKLYIYLPRGALISVFDARCPLAHLYRLHPGSGHIAKTVGECCAAQIRYVFGEHLDIGAAESKEFYLSCSRGSVAVAYIDRGVGRERLAEVAAGSAYQLALTNEVGIVHAVTCLDALGGFDHHLLEVVGLGGSVLLRREGLGRQHTYQ